MVDVCVCVCVQGKIRKDLLVHAFTEGAVLDAFFRNVDALSFLFQDFCARHEVGSLSTPKEDAEVGATHCAPVPPLGTLRVAADGKASAGWDCVLVRGS